jgi:hypothetical protein
MPDMGLEAPCVLALESARVLGELCRTVRAGVVTAGDFDECEPEAGR